ncbi:MAG TPA: cob(I)yrinic acid a,c-diamide adenosyltransferase, partial [Chthonomonadales bacterium]|nr:cob(I)yrinic acid a,c-diamide adenosyltransferase [Chthonomonadales bacterium]
VGAAAAVESCADLQPLLFRIQKDLLALGADLATPAGTAHGSITVMRMCGESTSRLEKEIDSLEAELEPLTRFILPGGHPQAAALHVARAVCRRAERELVAFRDGDEQETNPELLKYLNRLSDLLFVAARIANSRNGISDVLWFSE